MRKVGRAHAVRRFYAAGGLTKERYVLNLSLDAEIQ
jgi:hypothetical protein